MNNKTLNKQQKKIERRKIYAYTQPQYEKKLWKRGSKVGIGFLKIGQTSRTAKERIKEDISGPYREFSIELIHYVKLNKDNQPLYSDHRIHERLEQKGVNRFEDTEWFECSIEEVKQAIIELETGITVYKDEIEDWFELREEQKNAINKTKQFFKQCEETPGKFLWNAKMRFGKTFTSYKLIEEMDWKNVLILTYKPAVENSWFDTIKKHIDFQWWGFKSLSNSRPPSFKNQPNICFFSFQYLLGKTNPKKEQFINDLKKIHWDCIILDEYHFGAWKPKQKSIYSIEEANYNTMESTEDLALEIEEEGLNLKFSPEKEGFISKYQLFLSGTPFRAISVGEFHENQIFNWSYLDEQDRKDSYLGVPNPYEIMPRLNIMLYSLPESFNNWEEFKNEVAMFDFGSFLKTNCDNKEKSIDKKDVRFINENDVDKWLNFIKGESIHKASVKKKFPYYNNQLRKKTKHSLWFLPSVASCYAMVELLKRDSFFNKHYEIICVAGTAVKNGKDAIELVKKTIKKAKMDNDRGSITLSCGRLTHGVTVPEWSAVLYLTNTTSIELYLQTIFRAQSPWIKKKTNEIIKNDCYVFDFYPTRTIKLIYDYIDKTYGNEDLEKNIKRFLDKSPINIYENGDMKQINQEEIRNLATAPIGTKILSEKWQSSLLITLDSNIMSKILNNKDLLAKLKEVKFFRRFRKSKKEKVIDFEKTLGEYIRINKKNQTKKKQQKVLTKEEREINKERERIRRIFLKFLARIPIFMYLTKNREKKLKHLIVNSEPELFEEVTHIDINTFKTLCKIGIFRKSNMNKAVYQFRLIETNSLNYVGGNEEEIKKKVSKDQGLHN